MRHLTSKIIGSTAVVALIGVTALGLRQRRRDNRTRKLMTALQIVVRPVSKQLSSENAFNIHYLTTVLQKVKREVLVLKTSSAQRYAQRIHSAWKPWYQGGDDEDRVYSVFRSLKDKVQVSQVAKVYQDRYSKNLIDTLKDRFDTKEIHKVLDIVKDLPNYRTA